MSACINKNVEKILIIYSVTPTGLLMIMHLTWKLERRPSTTTGVRLEEVEMFPKVSQAEK